LISQRAISRFGEPGEKIRSEEGVDHRHVHGDQIGTGPKRRLADLTRRERSGHQP
jgi:hypothetical protein